MIKYRLICKECDLLFDSWFASSLEYEKLKKKSFLSCLNCNSKKIEKTLMAPKLMSSFRIEKKEKRNSKFLQINNKIKKYQRFIKNNFKFVGENFTYEARSIHYQNKNKGKGIYGTASKKDLKELKEEGIEAQVIPWIEDKNN